MKNSLSSLVRIITAVCVLAAALHGQSSLTGSWHGSGTPDTEPFGGPPYCSYSVTMQNVQLSINFDVSGNVTAATASALMIEQALNGCPFPPIPQNTHQFSGTGTVQGNTVTLQLTGAPSNNPGDIGKFTGTLNSAGHLQGTLTFIRTDQQPPLAWQTHHTVDLTGPPPVAPIISTSSLPNGEVTIAYSQTLAATSGSPPYSKWNVSSGSLPTGLTLNSSTGVISGTSTTAGSFSFSVTVGDSAAATSQPKSLSISIITGPAVINSSLPGGTVGDLLFPNAGGLWRYCVLQQLDRFFWNAAYGSEFEFRDRRHLGHADFGDGLSVRLQRNCQGQRRSHFAAQEPVDCHRPTAACHHNFFAARRRGGRHVFADTDGHRYIAEHLRRWWWRWVLVRFFRNAARGVERHFRDWGHQRHTYDARFIHLHRHRL
jgi:hypothetical protein